MTYKKKIVILTIFALFLIFTGYSLGEFIKFEFETCGSGYINQNNNSEKINLIPSCGGYRKYLESLGENIGAPLILFSAIFIFFLFIFYFLKEKFFRSWFKFASIFIPLSIVIISLLPSTDGDFISPSSKEISFFLFPILFIITSIIIIINKSSKSHKGGSNIQR